MPACSNLGNPSRTARRVWQQGVPRPPALGHPQAQKGKGAFHPLSGGRGRPKYSVRPGGAIAVSQLFQLKFSARGMPKQSHLATKTKTDMRRCRESWPNP